MFKSKKIHKKWWFWITIFLVIFIGWQVFQFFTFHSVTKNLQIKCLAVSDLLAKGQFKEIKAEVENCQQAIFQVSDQLMWWRFSTLNIFHDTIDATNNVLVSLANTLPDIKRAAELGESWQQSQKNGQTSWLFLLKHAADLTKLNERLDQDQKAIREALSVPAWFFQYLKFKSLPYLDTVAQVTKIGKQILPYIDVLAEAIGSKESKTYLVFFQNSAELRPTGGFWGSYGLLTVKDGAIKSFVTDDIYHVDVLLVDKKDLPPYVEPLAKYLAGNGWRLRDANWSPDFPTSAQMAIELYQKSGATQEISGVIAINPGLVEDLLLQLGSVVIDGQEYNRENFLTQLEYEVEHGYKNKGVSGWDRKDILNALANKFLERLPTSLKDQKAVTELLPLVLKNLEEKNVIFYSVNPVLQKQFEVLGWADEIRQTNGDYLNVVDANLASFKTDAFIDRQTSYYVKEETDKNGKKSLLAHLVLHYNHRGSFDWRTTRYRTYTRVYVPQGSTLVSVVGAMDNDRSTVPGKSDVYNEFDKTVFGAFISIEPKRGGQLEFVYKLPDSLLVEYQKGSYRLLIQKQPGVDNKTIGLKLEITKKPIQVNWINKQHYFINNQLIVNDFAPKTDSQLEVKW